MAQFPYLAGGNYLPSNAINQLEMWQAETFVSVTLDREFGRAAHVIGTISVSSPWTIPTWSGIGYHS